MEIRQERRQQGRREVASRQEKKNWTGIRNLFLGLRQSNGIFLYSWKKLKDIDR